MRGQVGLAYRARKMQTHKGVKDNAQMRLNRAQSSAHKRSPHRKLQPQHAARHHVNGSVAPFTNSEQPPAPLATRHYEVPIILSAASTKIPRRRTLTGRISGVGRVPADSKWSCIRTFCAGIPLYVLPLCVADVVVPPRCHRGAKQGSTRSGTRRRSPILLPIEA